MTIDAVEGHDISLENPAHFGLLHDLVQGTNGVMALRPGRKPRARLRARDPGARDPAAATAFLGTQGGICDTQWDMFLAGVGANAARLERLRSAR